MVRDADTLHARHSFRRVRRPGLRADGVERALICALALGYALAALTPCLGTDATALGMRAVAVPQTASGTVPADLSRDSHAPSRVAHAAAHSHDHAEIDAPRPHDERPPDGWCRSGRRPAVWLAVCPCGCDERAAPGGFQAEKGVLDEIAQPVPRWHAARFPEPSSEVPPEAPRAIDTVPIPLSLV